MSDNVNHPSHYTSGNIECIDAIRASMSTKGFVDYCKGNVIKYVFRWEHKGGLEDLKKAQVYLGWAIEAIEKLPDTEVKGSIEIHTSPEERKKIIGAIERWQMNAELREKMMLNRHE